MAEREMTQEELDALPPDVRKALGLTPTPERPATAEDLAAAGMHPAPAPQPSQSRQPVLRLPFMDSPSAKLDTFALRGAEAVPAGGMLTDLIGTAILKAAKMRGVGDPGAVIPPKAQADLYQLATKEGLSPEDAEAQIRDPGNTIGDVGDVYRRLRDTRRADSAALSKENPWSGRLGAGVGTVASMLAPLPGFKGAGTFGRIAASAATGAGYGALTGFTDGESDLSRGDWKGTARDIVDNALGGAAFGAGVGALSEGASRAWPWLRRYAINKGREVLSGGSDIAAASRRPLSDEAVEEVLASGGIRAFDTTPQTNERVANLAEEAGALQGEIIHELQARGVPGPEVEPLAQELTARYLEAFRNSGANKGPANVFADEAANLRNVAGGNPHLELEQSEAIKRTLQRDARYHRRQASPNEESLQQAASLLRQAGEDAVERGAAASADPEVQTLSNAFVPAKQRTGRLLEAEEFADRAAAKYLQKPSVSAFDRLTGAATSGGNPVQAELQAQALSQARRRLPSALARYTYDLSQGMQTGAVTPAISKAFALMFDPTATDTASALLDYLQRNQKKDDKR